MDRSRSRSRSRSPSRSDSYHKRRRSRSRSRSKNRSRSRSPRYRRDYSSRGYRDQDRYYNGPQDNGFLEKRKKQREESVPSRAVWAKSPPRPTGADDESHSDSDSANRRMHRKEDKKDKRKHKDKKRRDKKDKKDKKEKRDKRKSKKRKRSRSRDSNDRDRKRPRKERDSSSSDSESDEAQVWTEKKVAPVVVQTTEGDDFGPMPLPQVGAVQRYGGQMLPGEAEAYAQFVQQNKRIPRRGEVGMSTEQIEDMETLGYVMSGNRNKRMTAVRIRKENQVLTAEEKRQLVQTQLEEKAKKENKIIADMRELVSQKFKQQQQE